MENKFSLSELNLRIKDALLEAFPATVWVIAEISELKENRSGHCYLELIEKEGNEIVARTRATIWSYTYRMLKPYFETTTGEYFTQGIKVLVQVTVEYHAAFGLSLNIKDIDPTYTLGDLALQRKEIIHRLQEEGVFDMNKGLELPLVPQKIAIISSATAAGYQDFINQLENNEYGFVYYTRLFEAYMQGAETVPSIINALERIFRYEDFFDAVVVIRGGGATADLSSFDNYELAFNITQFPLPVITGIGHEKDDTIIDLVAHTRMKTPTAVAEFLIAGVLRFYEKLTERENTIVELAAGLLETQKNKLEQIAENISDSVSEFIGEKQRQLTKKGNILQQNVAGFSYNRKYEINNLKHDIDSALLVWFVETKNRLNQKKRILKRVSGEQILKEKSALTHLKDLLESKSKKMLYKAEEKVHLSENTVRLLDPENILKRGYSITYKNGKLIKSVKQVLDGDEIETRLADGNLKSKIKKS